MSKAHKVSENTLLDSTLPQIELKLGKQTFYLCFTFKALTVAQKNLRDAGVHCNILAALALDGDADKLVPLLYAALITHQPKMTALEAADLVTIRNLNRIYEAISEAYAASMAEPDEDAGDKKANPEEAE